MTVRPIPEGYHTLSPYLLVEGVERLLDYLADAFDAHEILHLRRPDGSIMHAEMRIGDSRVMLGEPLGELGPMPASVYLYVEDCDAVYRRAIDAGGDSVMVPTTMEHAGERYGGVRDPAGNIWWIATRVEDVPAEEQERRVERLRHHWPAP